VKAREPPVYISKKELTELLIFCGNFGAEPWFDFWWPYNSDYDNSFVSLTPVEVMTLEGADGETEKSFRVKEEIAKEVGHHRDEFTVPRSEQRFEQGSDQGYSSSLEVANSIPVGRLEELKESGRYREQGVLRELL
jgi:Holliday junction resolvase